MRAGATNNGGDENENDHNYENVAENDHDNEDAADGEADAGDDEANAGGQVR